MPPNTPETSKTVVRKRHTHHGQQAPRYMVVDVNSEWFPNSRNNELVQLYATVFNGVKGVKAKWTEEMARRLLQDRRQRPGVMIAIFDRKIDPATRKMPMVGAFFANIVPGRDGVRMTEPDIVIVPKYRELGLGKEVGWLGRRRANEIAKQLFGETPRIDESQTYKKLDFPKSWWQRSGYHMLKLYTQTAEELLSRPLPRSPNLVNVTFHDAKEPDFAKIAEFMSAPSTQTSDGDRWAQDRALTFLKFMRDKSPATMQVAKRNNEIVGFMIADVIPRRSGPSLVDLHYFAKPTNKIAKNGHPLTAEEVAPALFQHVVIMANGLSTAKYRLALNQIEVSNGDMDFFRAMKIMPEIEEDKDFLAMRGSHTKLSNSFRPSKRLTEFASGGLTP